MKLRYLLMSAAVLTATVGGAISPIVANADTDYQDATHATTDGKITFIEDDSPVNPVDPENPEVPVEPVDPINPNGAELMITYASNLNFGTQSKQGTTWNAYADKVKDDSTGESRDIVPFVSVKDSRGTDRDGWKLTVKQDGEFKNGTNVLEGAQLTFSGLRYANTGNEPTATSGSIVLGEEAAIIAQADDTAGTGITSLALGTLAPETETDASGNQVQVNKTAGVNLSIPKRTAINSGTYSTSVTYELTAGVE